MRKSNRVLAIALAAITMVTCYQIVPVAAEEGMSNRMKTALEFANTALYEGRFFDDKAIAGLFADGLNVDSREPVVWVNNGIEYSTSNMAWHQNLFEGLNALTKMTGDQRYKEAAIQEARHYFDEYTDSNSIFYWGGHRMLEMEHEGIIGEQNYHELKSNFPCFDILYEADPQGTLNMEKALWNAHVLNWENLEQNRHGIYDNKMGDVWNSEWGFADNPWFTIDGLPFASGVCVLNFAAVDYSKRTGDKAPLTWIKRMCKLFLMTRHPVTGIGGFQYGTYIGGDRAYAQYGEQFGESAAHEAWTWVRSGEVDAYIQTMVPMIMLCNEIGEPEMASDFAGIFESVCKYMYRPELNALEPMFADGTSVLGVSSPRGSYYGYMEKTYIPTKPFYVKSGVYSYFNQTNPSQLVWDTVRQICNSETTKFAGDIGTKPGENVNLNYNTECSDYELAMTFLYLYEKTKCIDYLNMAKHIGDNIIKYNFYKGLFVKDRNYYEAWLDNPDFYTLLCIEAYDRGTPELCPIKLNFSAAKTHWDYDGRGRVYDEDIRYKRPRVEPNEIKLNKNSIVLKAGAVKNYDDVVGHWAQRTINVLQSRGILNADGGVYRVNDNMTRAEFLAVLNRMGVFATMPYKAKYEDIKADDWYAEIVTGADYEGLLDVEFCSNDRVRPNDPITREEAAGFAAKALIKIAPKKAYKGKWYTDKFSDKDQITAWYDQYINMLCTTGIMKGVSSTEFAPKATLTRGEAAEIFYRLDNMRMDSDIEATVFPETATDKEVTYESSNPEVVVVNEDGILSAIAPGNAVITVSTYNGLKTYCDVTVQPLSEGALSTIRVAESKIEGFDPEIYHYVYHCASGTKKAPKISAVAYSGDVKITTPDSLPGTAKIETGTKTYTIDIIADKLMYVLNEDFEKYEADVAGTDQVDAGYPFTSPSYNQGTGYLPITVKNRDDEIGGKCLYLPVDDTSSKVRQLFMNLPKTIEFGMSADDLQLVLDVDIKLDNKNNNIAFGFKTQGQGNVVAYFGVQNSNIIATTPTGTVTVCSVEEYLNSYFNLKVVIDKRNFKFDVYVNDKLKGANLDCASREVVCRYIYAQAAHNSKSQTWLDNFKIYTAAVEMAKVSDVQTGTDEETEDETEFTPMYIDFNDAEMLKSINGQLGFSTSSVNAEGGTYPITVDKRPYKLGISDKLLHLPGLKSGDAIERVTRLNLSGPIQLGESARDGKFVLEYEFLVPGNSPGMGVALTDKSENNIARFYTTGASYRYENDFGDKVLYYDEGEKIVRGFNQFIKCKIVIDMKKCTADIYKGKELLASGVKLNKGSESKKISKLKIFSDTTATRDFYIDNIKMYYEN